MLSFLHRTPPSRIPDQLLDKDVPTGLYVPGDTGSRFPKIHRQFRPPESPLATGRRPRGGRVGDISSPSKENPHQLSAPSRDHLSSLDNLTSLRDPHRRYALRPVAIAHIDIASQSIATYTNYHISRNSPDPNPRLDIVSDNENPQQPRIFNARSTRGIHVEESKATDISLGVTGHGILEKSFPIQSSDWKLAKVGRRSKIKDQHRSSPSKNLHNETYLDGARAGGYIDTESPRGTLSPNNPIDTLKSVNPTLVENGCLDTPASALLGTFQPRKRSNTSPPTYHTPLPIKIRSPLSPRQERIWQIPAFDDMDQLSRQLEEDPLLDRLNTSVTDSVRRARPVNPNRSIGRRNRIVHAEDYTRLQISNI